MPLGTSCLTVNAGSVRRTSRFFNRHLREISDQGTLSGIKQKIADAKAEAGSDYYAGDDVEDAGRAH
jgi:hypothetical protein